MESPKKKAKYSGRFQDEWIIKFNGVIVKGKDENYAHCKICKREVKVAASGVYDVKEHIKSNMHQRNAREFEKQPTINCFTAPKASSAPTHVLRAEVLMTNFIVQNHLPLSVADRLCDLLPKMCTDSSIAKNIKCKRTKCTQIAKRCLAVEATAHVIEHCKVKPFSIMIDESNDQKTDKRLAILIRMFTLTNGTKTRMLDMPVCNDGTAEAIFNKLDAVLRYLYMCKQIIFLKNNYVRFTQLSHDLQTCSFCTFDKA